jgi:SAM-dependent methyltransferase
VNKELQKCSDVLMACPVCQQGLEQSDAGWLCSRCGKVGTDVDGLPCFNDPNYYWGEIPREEMERANTIARESDWQQAVDQVVKAPGVREYITDPRRADFQYIWDLPRDSRILDIGAGWGAIASGLGKNFDRVVAVEGVLQRARFIDARVRQLGLDSVKVICADFLRLPLAPGQFDAVVLNGVLEWIGLASPAGNPRDLQLQFLRKVHSLLKPSGFACVGIENRVGWAALRYGEDHSGLRYTSLMPRGMASLWCNWRGRAYRSDANRGYRTYTYSLPGYRKLFTEAGFHSVKPYHAWDGYNKPSVLLPLDDKRALTYFLGRFDLQHSTTGPLKFGFLKKLTARAKYTFLKQVIASGLWAQLASEYMFLVGK